MCEQDPPDHNTPQLIGRRGRLSQVNLVRFMHKVKSYFFFFFGTSGSLVDPSIIEGRHESQTGKRQLSFSPLSPAAAAEGSRCEM
jgi:hypothetical protein